MIPILPHRSDTVSEIPSGSIHGNIYIYTHYIILYSIIYYMINYIILYIYIYTHTNILFFSTSNSSPEGLCSQVCIAVGWCHLKKQVEYAKSSMATCRAALLEIMGRRIFGWLLVGYIHNLHGIYMAFIWHLYIVSIRYTIYIYVYIWHFYEYTLWLFNIAMV